jgi:hypothetical protein
MFQQFDTTPSMAPVATRATTPARPTTIPARRLPVRKLLGLGIVAFSLITIGYQVTRVLDSLALGILAADFAFLITAAAWAAISDRR